LFPQIKANLFALIKDSDARACAIQKNCTRSASASWRMADVLRQSALSAQAGEEAD